MPVHLQGPWSPLLGRLSLKAIPYHNGIVDGAFVFAALGALVVLFVLTRYRLWGYLIREWLTSLDHKKIGVMYIVLGLVMLFRGFIDAVMMRTQQMMAAGPHSAGHLQALHGYLPPYHFDQVYGSHGTIMILFAVTPILTGLTNIIVPLQIGARDMAFPLLNAISLWLTGAGAALVMISLFVGDFSQAGWIGLIPLSELSYSPGVGVDYWMWALQISSVGTTLNAVNMIATIVKLRAPGMAWMRLPFVSWATLSTQIIGLTAFPVLGVALAMLGCDRYLGTHFFTAGLGGNLMLYTNLFWIWGHPEVYFVVLPAFGFISEIVPVFAEKPLFGYPTMVAATFAIAGISWMVWLHHFFTMGAGPGVNLFYSTATMLVGIPTGVKVFNWGLTLYRGRLRYEAPMLWAVGAIFLLLVGGLTGVMLALPAVNYTVHNSVFVVAHFHTMMLLILYASFGAFEFWFPKVFGFRFDAALAKRHFWSFTVGTLLVFGAMYALGFMGLTRRLDAPLSPHYLPLLIIEEIGIFFYWVSVYYFALMIWRSIRERANNRVGPDAWGTGRTLEWLTHSPVPFYNFAVLPQIHERDEVAWRRDRHLLTARPPVTEDIEMPKNTVMPVLIGALAGAFGFGMVWRIWWLAGLALLGIIGVVVLRAFAPETGQVIPAETLRRMEEGLQAKSIVEDHVSPPIAEFEVLS